MFHLLFGAAVAAPLVAFVVPFVAISRLSAGIDRSDVIASARSERHGAMPADCIQRAWSANEFAFERAIDAYEDLIDITARRLP
jgi:hypothetical protein